MTEWFDFPDFEYRYQITRDGQVRSKVRLVNSPVAGGQRRIGGKILKLANVRGYWCVCPRTKGKGHSVLVHRAIAKLFVPNPDNKPHINHKDGNKTNNAPENLEWCTHKENMQHAYRTGLAMAPVVGPGEACPAHKLSDADVRNIKRRLIAGESQTSIARCFEISQANVSSINCGKTWSHIAP